MRITVEGMDKLSQLLAEMPKRNATRVREALHNCLNDLKGKSKRIAPKDIGTLRGSAYYKTTLNKNEVSGELGYFEEYATRQHEELGYKHKEGQAKYLETPLKENIEDYIKQISKAVRRLWP